jgi:osmotically-inducible protein OsmY
MSETMCTSVPTDAELKQRVSEFLTKQGRVSLQRIKIDVSDGVVTLTGNVSTFYEKQLCLECLSRVAGVTRLVDAIHVI